MTPGVADRAAIVSYYRAQNDYTTLFYDLGTNFLIAQDICYTELSGRNSFV